MNGVIGALDAEDMGVVVAVSLGHPLDALGRRAAVAGTPQQAELRIVQAEIVVGR